MFSLKRTGKNNGTTIVQVIRGESKPESKNNHWRDELRVIKCFQCIRTRETHVLNIFKAQCARKNKQNDNVFGTKNVGLLLFVRLVLFCRTRFFVTHEYGLPKSFVHRKTFVNSKHSYFFPTFFDVSIMSSWFTYVPVCFFRTCCTARTVGPRCNELN